MRAKWFFLLSCVLAGFLGGYALNTQRALQTARTVYLKIEPFERIDGKEEQTKLDEFNIDLK